MGWTTCLTLCARGLDLCAKWRPDGDSEVLSQSSTVESDYIRLRTACAVGRARHAGIVAPLSCAFSVLYSIDMFLGYTKTQTSLQKAWHGPLADAIRLVTLRQSRGVSRLNTGNGVNPNALWVGHSKLKVSYPRASHGYSICQGLKRFGSVNTNVCILRGAARRPCPPDQAVANKHTAEYVVN
jgi:hypothetical protein